MNAEKEERFIRELMEKSGRKMPFVDFENKLMEQIHKEADHSRSFLKDVKLSWFFFLVGSCFGLFLSIVAGQMNETFLGFPAQRMILLVQVVFVILLLSQFDKLIELTRKRN
jgi:hypothetical protein